MFTTRSTILGLNERYPWAAGVVAVPVTIVALLGVIMLPYLFVPLLVLAGVALVVTEYYALRQETDEHHTRAVAGAWQPDRPAGSNTEMIRGTTNLPQAEWEARARAAAAAAHARAAEARARAEATQARALAAEAEALAAEAEVFEAQAGATEASHAAHARATEARNRAARLRLEADAKSTRWSPRTF
ncbi:hypothetical protein DQP55_05605 [Mycolicibacterium sp. GF69]|nr:hypothetical protein DQP55_05605 [Mycolicibacterium sp. GF69]